VTTYIIIITTTTTITTISVVFYDTVVISGYIASSNGEMNNERHIDKDLERIGCFLMDVAS
jgi:hypothetical protein